MCAGQACTEACHLIGLYFKKDNIWSAPFDPESANFRLSLTSLTLTKWRREREREREKVFISGLVVTRACSQEQMIQTGQKKSDNWRLCRLRNSSPALSIYWDYETLHLTVQVKSRSNLSLLQSVSAVPACLLSLSPSQGNIENESKLCAVKLCCYYKLLEFVNMTATFYLLKMIKVGDFNLAEMSSLIESLRFPFLNFTCQESVTI